MDVRFRGKGSEFLGVEKDFIQASVRLGQLVVKNRMAGSLLVLGLGHLIEYQIQHNKINE